MNFIFNTKTTNSTRLERWLGAPTVEKLSRDLKNWYGPPIAVAGVPGNVRVCGDGDFIGDVRSGYEMSVWDRAECFLRRVKRGLRRSVKNSINGKVNAGFASLSDLIAEATAGKKRIYNFQKAGPTGVVAVTSSLWRLGNLPAAGSAGSAAPGGRALTDATTGAFPFTNPDSGDTQHFVLGNPSASTAGNTLLLYDRIFDVAKTMNSSTAESVTGVPTRYQSSIASNDDYAGGNFCFPEVGGTALANTAHNWTVCRYRNQAGTDAQSFPSATGVAQAIVDRLDLTASNWFMPLAAGDTGVMDLDQMQCSASVATGAINFVIGHPIAFMPCPIANMICPLDGINTAFNLVRIFDDAALAFLEVNKPATTATNYNGNFVTVSG